MDRRTFLKGSLVVGLAPSILKGLPEKKTVPDVEIPSEIKPDEELYTFVETDTDHYEVDVRYGDDGPHYKKIVHEPKTTFVATREGQIVRIRVRRVDRYGFKSDWLEAEKVPVLTHGDDLTIHWEE